MNDYAYLAIALTALAGLMGIWYWAVNQLHPELFNRDAEPVIPAGYNISVRLALAPGTDRPEWNWRATGPDGKQTGGFYESIGYPSRDAAINAATEFIRSLLVARTDTVTTEWEDVPNG